MLDYSGMMLFGGLAILLGGIFCIVGGGLNLSIFMDSPQAQPLIQSLGRTGARLFYLVLGVVFILAGGFMTFRGVQLFQQP
jgi:hypothetical protein